MTALSDFAISEQAIAEVFAPFLVQRFPPGDPHWQKIVDETVTRLRGRRLKKRFLGWLPKFRRTQRGLMHSYSEQWSNISFERQLGGKKPLPFEWREQGMLAYGSSRKKLHLFLVGRAIAELSPQSVLEVGSGNGFNLLLLSQQFPQTSFTGLELTPGGVQAASAARNEPKLPEILRQFSARSLVDESAHQRIQLMQGSAAALPFPSKSFDLVYTVLALEQMEEVRKEALQEISRVARRHVVMIEPFRDWNDEGHRRDYIVSNDYFSAWISDLSRYGMTPRFVFGDIPNKLDFRVGLVIASPAEVNA